MLAGCCWPWQPSSSVRVDPVRRAAASPRWSRRLYADITTGYGPECFSIPGRPEAGPYHLSIHYYAQVPMGYGMGLLQIQRFDGTDFIFVDRPYVIMNDQAFVDLGRYR